MIFSFPPVFVSAEEKTISVDFGKLYNITYEAKDVTIFEVIPNSDDIELIFIIDVTSPISTLELTIPRELLDSQENGNDIDFFIIADNDDVTFSEKETSITSRTLLMQLSPGTTELEIFGTQLGNNISENESTVEEPKEESTEEIPQETTEEPQIVETPDESLPTEETSEEEEAPVTEDKTPQTIQNIFDFSKLPSWSIAINERQMQQFAMTAGAFAALVIVLIIFKGLRSEQSLP